MNSDCGVESTILGVTRIGLVVDESISLLRRRKSISAERQPSLNRRKIQGYLIIHLHCLRRCCRKVDC